MLICLVSVAGCPGPPDACCTVVDPLAVVLLDWSEVMDVLAMDRVERVRSESVGLPSRGTRLAAVWVAESGLLSDLVLLCLALLETEEMDLLIEDLVFCFILARSPDVVDDDLAVEEEQSDPAEQEAASSMDPFREKFSL